MLLRVEHLETHFLLREGVLRAVDDVSFEIERGETVAVVGESGCGKTIVALSLLRLVQRPGRIVGGRVLFEGEDLLSAPEARLRATRGGSIGLVFQEPGASLNPVIPIGRQLQEVLRLHRALDERQSEREAVRLLGELGIPEPERRARGYAFQLSGGMRQRVGIALAIAGRPRLLVADEPTTALDVTVQAEILDLLAFLQAEHDMAILIITHDVGVVAEIAERVLVMYTGRIVEEARALDLFQNARHPYTIGLLAAAPRLEFDRTRPFRGIGGAVPDLLDLPSGCTFHPRCSLTHEACIATAPPLLTIGDVRRCACHAVNASTATETAS